MKRVLIVILLLLCLGAAGGGFFLWKDQKNREAQEADYQQTRQQLSMEQVMAAGKDPLWSIPVDFDRIRKENPDIYAWITIPDTDIDDPVLQSAEEGKYLNQDALGQENEGGAIYSEMANQQDFSDMLTVLYGRSTVAGGRFADLLNYEDAEYLQAHNLITIYTPTGIHYYQIFAAYRYDDRHLLKSFDCSEERVYNSYIKGILEQRNLYACIDASVSPQWPQKILTLSTGHPSGDSYRYLVQAVEIREQQFSTS